MVLTSANKMVGLISGDLAMPDQTEPSKARPGTTYVNRYAFPLSAPFLTEGRAQVLTLTTHKPTTTHVRTPAKKRHRRINGGLRSRRHTLSRTARRCVSRSPSISRKREAGLHDVARHRVVARSARLLYEPVVVEGDVASQAYPRHEQV